MCSLLLQNTGNQPVFTITITKPCAHVSMNRGPIKNYNTSIDNILESLKMFYIY